ncbi:ABC transporter substrate-binding protein [Plantactinospora sp. CA-290183]|uniref:ABC transporter substrate-binding protein n=1 Tax=Plantactinospora sp. CA-290183 TaxID=3240006 RepID=UPI003D8C3120
MTRAWEAAAEMAAPAVGGWRLGRRGFLVAAAGGALAACGRETGDVRPPRRESGELVIGASLELTGVGQSLGVLQERALRITLDQLNADGIPVGNQRRRIRLIVQDNASDPGIAARQATELAARENVHALLGGCLAETSLAMIPVVQDQQVPFVSLASADGIALPLAQRTYVYKLAPDSRDVARALARLIRTQKHERVALLAGTGAHGDSGVQAVTRAFETLEQELVRVARLPGGAEPDLGAAVRRVLDREPDAVVVWATAPTSGAAARALRDAGYEGDIFFDAGAVAEETLSPDNTPAVEGAYVVHPISLSGSSLTNTTSAGLARRDFVFRYLRQYGSFSGFAPYASDALQLIANAARLGKSVDRGRLRAYLQNQVTEGIAGAYSFGPIRHGGMEAGSLGVFKVSRGAWSRIS